MKRSREDVPSRDAQDQQKTSEEGQKLIEEIVTVEETHSILVRFPCLDFFRDARLCEVTVGSKEAEGDNSNHDKNNENNKNSEGDENTSVNNNNNNINNNNRNNGNETKYFSPDAVTFKDGTLETDHPIVLVHTQHYGIMEFEGTWCDVHVPQTSTTPLSNRVVVQLCEKSSEQALLDGISTNGESQMKESQHGTVVDAKSVGAGVEVASLLKHPSVGVTADDARGLQAARNASWAYGRIDVPCATLVLHRVK
ncbi:uncharacterized protein TM35_000052820 [Trypanosoma theileri]|uniref:Uncharacterized protein n=1 Tax=Trypanosoma theileri TaxID=67003 RepID=A0A1X0P427_9TRYP|nr:uncharacterized protein TM35_000052820 [Trypanosoma theileri]ORC91686.1 hypothetical protein TM35_000052820 [Trypanosoma theileri]